MSDATRTPQIGKWAYKRTKNVDAEYWICQSVNREDAGFFCAIDLWEGSRADALRYLRNRDEKTSVCVCVCVCVYLI